MRAFRTFLSIAFFLASVVPALAEERLFEFERLRGIPTGGLAVGDIPGGGIPWTIGRGEARLDTDGRLKVEVEGLVLAGGPRAGTNPVDQFIATLSCLNADGTINNVSTDPVPATVTGDARIEELLTLPEVCLGPIVFVRGVVGPTPRWFAISGFQFASSLVLLGMEANQPEYGYILAEDAQPQSSGARRIVRFVEKPDVDTARALIGRGALWNTLVVVFSP